MNTSEEGTERALSAVIPPDVEINPPQVDLMIGMEMDVAQEVLPSVPEELMHRFPGEHLHLDQDQRIIGLSQQVELFLT